jgi:Transposase DDE domain group 1
VKVTASRPKITVVADGRGLVGHAGARLLADVADVTGLTGQFSVALASLRQRDSGHDPGRVAVDVAVMLADGGESIADIAVLRDQAELFGLVASDATTWRVLDGIDDRLLAGLRAARAAAREVAWAQLADTRGGLPAATAAGRDIPGLVIDIDASIVPCHSEKENAAPTWKKTFGYYPLFAFLDNTREALAGLLRKGNAGSGTAADHIAVLDAALEQIPDAHRYGTDILIRTDTAGCSRAFLAHTRGLRQLGMRTFFSVGMPITAPIRDAIVAATAWIPALDTDGDLREGAQVVEITHLVTPDLLAAYPHATRLICRRERPHPGAQLDLFDTIEGFRHQVFATDTPVAGGGSIQYLEARHRAHARVEDRIRTGKDSGLGRFPSRQFNINQAWLELALTGIDLTCWTQLLLLHGELAQAEPKKLRYRLLHTAARIVHTGRRILLRINVSWPWATDLAQAFERLTWLPRPAG